MKFLFLSQRKWFKKSRDHYKCKKMKIVRFKHAVTQTIRPWNHWLSSRNLFCKILKNDWVLGEKTSWKILVFATLRTFWHIFRPKLGLFSRFFETNFCLIISDSRRNANIFYRVFKKYWTLGICNKHWRNYGGGGATLLSPPPVAPLPPSALLIIVLGTT